MRLTWNLSVTDRLEIWKLTILNDSVIFNKTGIRFFIGHDVKYLHWPKYLRQNKESNSFMLNFHCTPKFSNKLWLRTLSLISGTN